MSKRKELEECSEDCNYGGATRGENSTCPGISVNFKQTDGFVQWVPPLIPMAFPLGNVLTFNPMLVEIDSNKLSAVSANGRGNDNQSEKISARECKGMPCTGTEVLKLVTREEVVEDNWDSVCRVIKPAPNLSRKKFRFKRPRSKSPEKLDSDESSYIEVDESLPNSYTENLHPLSPIKKDEIKPHASFITGVYRKLQKNSDAWDILTACAPRNSIKSNTLFVYDVAKMVNRNDHYWRKDGYFWKHRGSVVCHCDGTSWNVIIHRLISGSRVVDFYRKEFRILGQEFESVTSWKDPKVYIVYFSIHGKFALKDYEEKQTHGNSKRPHEKAKTQRLSAFLQVQGNANSDDDDDFADSGKMYYRTSETCKENIRQALKDGLTPAQTHSIALHNAMVSGGKPEDCPRNRDQIYQLKKLAKGESTIEDELAEVWKLSLTRNYLPLVKIENKKMLAVMLSPSMKDHLKDIFNVIGQITVHYDTTYNIGNFYCSILCFKHPFLESNPVIPLAFLFHQGKDEGVHASFMECIKKNVPELNGVGVVFVTDREAGIKNSIECSFPLAYKAFCHRHLKENVMHWRSNSVAMDQRKSYAEDVMHLLQCKSQDEFDEIRMQNAEKWKPEFLNYFTKCLEKDVIQSSRFNTEWRGIYYPLGGVSNNPSECTNSSFKSYIGDKTPKTMLEALYKAYFYCYTKFNEIKLGILHGTGNYHVSAKYLFVKSRLELGYGENIMDIKGLEGIFKNGTFSVPPVEIPNNEVVGLEDMNYKRGIADFFVKTDRVKIIGGTFSVFDLNNHNFQVNCVEETCSCGGKHCEHYMAVAKIIRKSEILAMKPQNKRKIRKSVTLSGLNARAVSSKAGRKAGEISRLRRKLFPTIPPCSRNFSIDLDGSNTAESSSLDNSISGPKNSGVNVNNDNETKGPSIQETNVTFWQLESPEESEVWAEDLGLTEEQLNQVLTEDYDMESEKVGDNSSYIADELNSAGISETVERCPCNEESEGPSIQCYACLKYYHHRCAAVSAYDLKTSSVDGMWFCGSCK